MEVPGYTAIRELGHGGSGRVMLAVRDADGLRVAVKLLSSALREDEEFAERFRAEAEVMRTIDSPHIARLLDHHEDPPAIVMELVDGVPLRRLIAQEGATGPQAALTVLKGSLLGLAEAHRHGVVHRDFKPENVMVTEDGRSKLVDFGVAARTGEAAPLVGTPPYMAPEQWDGEPAGPASDVYAATVVCYECLTGKRPFTGESIAALAYQHRNAEPDLSGIDGRVHGLLRHGLAKDPADRPESAEAFLAELEQVAVEAYGSRWEARGRSHLAALAVPFLGMRPAVEAVAGPSTTLGRTVFTPGAKLAVTAGLAVVTAAAVGSSFLIWNERSGPEGTPTPPVALSPPTSTPPASALPTTPPTPTTPPSTLPPTEAGSTTSPPPSSLAPPTVPPRTETPVRNEPSRTPTRRPTTTAPTPPRTQPTPTRTRTTSTRPTSSPPTSAQPTRPGPTRTQPTRTQAPEPTRPEPSDPPVRQRQPLLSVSVSVSLDVPVLRGGDRLVDLDLGLGLGTGLLGLVVVPGSVLLGRHMVVRRTRRRLPPHAGNWPPCAEEPQPYADK